MVEPASKKVELDEEPGAVTHLGNFRVERTLAEDTRSKYSAVLGSFVGMRQTVFAHGSLLAAGNPWIWLGVAHTSAPTGLSRFGGPSHSSYGGAAHKRRGRAAACGYELRT
eukprot:scaffold1800_cov387-Prasinococcus_capsulatus_cf.AAC.1